MTEQQLGIYLDLREQYKLTQEKEKALYASLKRYEELLIEYMQLTGVERIDALGHSFVVAERMSVSCPDGDCVRAVAICLEQGYDDALTINHQRAAAFAREGRDWSGILNVKETQYLQVRKKG